VEGDQSVPSSPEAVMSVRSGRSGGGRGTKRRREESTAISITDAGTEEGKPPTVTSNRNTYTRINFPNSSNTTKTAKKRDYTKKNFCVRYSRGKHCTETSRSMA